MGVLRLFVSIATALAKQPQRAIDDSLEKIAAEYADFSYIGERKSLESLVYEQARPLSRRLSKASDQDLTLLGLAERQVKSRKSLDPVELWFGRKWKSDSGLFPDFLLAQDESATFGNGALIELKNAKADQVASFNSTIPTRFKTLKDVEHINGSKAVSRATRLFDFPNSLSPSYLSQTRHCFYLIRTRAQSQADVRISLVEGSFFETLSTRELLRGVWKQMLEEAGVESDHNEILDRLSRLDQVQIAQSREIDKASVKPRFRIMSEAHTDGNPSYYSEIAPRTVNLIIKRERAYQLDWLVQEFAKESIVAKASQKGSEEFLNVESAKGKISLRFLTILHRRNGEHLVLQFHLPHRIEGVGTP